MNNLHGQTVILDGWYVIVEGLGYDIVDKWQMFLDVAHSPIFEIHVEETLVSSIKRAVFQSELQQGQVGLERGAEHKHPRVEAVGPPDVGSPGEFFPLEQVVHILQNLKIHALLVNSRTFLPDNRKSFGLPFVCRHDGHK